MTKQSPPHRHHQLLFETQGTDQNHLRELAKFINPSPAKLPITTKLSQGERETSKC